MDIQKVIDQALEIGKKESSKGTIATYIPELAKVDPNLIGISVMTLDGTAFNAGDVFHKFTFQSVGKVFVLARVLKEYGMKIFDKVNYEPSGDPFSSMVRLEDEKGRPRNPYINSGAILVSSMLPGKTSADKVTTLINFLNELCSKGNYKVNQSVYESEASTGFRNRAMANFLKQYELIDDVDIACDTYFQNSSIEVDLSELSRMSLFLANRGVDPLTNKRIISETCCKTVVTLMGTCGMYDQAGDVAINIGLPCKSAVSGTIFAVVPGKMIISVMSPPLGSKGNSSAGLAMLEHISKELDLSIYQ